MKFSYLTGEVGNIGISKVKKKVFGNSWWLAGGIESSTVAAVWQPIRAASLVASYLRIAGNAGNANIDPAIVGGVAPNWGNTTGWTGNGATMYLKTGIMPTTVQSVIVRFTGGHNLINRALFGSMDGSFVHYFQIIPWYVTGDSVVYGNGGNLLTGPYLDSGTLALAGQTAYRDGNPDGSIPPNTLPAFEIYLLGKNFAGELNAPSAGSIQAIAFYYPAITNAQAIAVHTAMMAL